MTTEARILSERYRVDGLLGRGGMASVYKGYDLTLGRDVAIKILAPELARDGAFRTRFRMEAQAASRMAHPTIVRVFDAGEATEKDASGVEVPVPYIVMELVHGSLLKDIISTGPMSVADAIRYTDGILEALEYSHRAGVVHRDIKPGNVMVTAEGQVKVMDFGIARAVSDSSSTVAETTQILGTAAYFAPEQAKGEPVDARADLYSTGVVLYEMLTGKQPFRGDTPVAIAYQHVSEAPVPPSEVNETVPRALDAIALRALAKDPYQRFQDAASFRRSLSSTKTGAITTTKRQVNALTSELYGPNPRQAADTARSLRQLSTDTTMKRTQSGPPVAWIWAGVLVLAVLLGSVLFWVLNLEPEDITATNAREVPAVSGQTYEEAAKALEATDLLPTRNDVPNADVAEGVVISTDPEAGENMKKGGTVRLTVSAGQELATVPTLVGVGRDAAAEALREVSLELGTVRVTNDPELAAGTVISAEAEAGDEVPVGSQIDIEVASGSVTIRDYTGIYTVDSAQAELEQAGLSVILRPEPGCKATNPTTVSQQSLAPGDVPIRSEITLTYCEGE